MRKAFLILAVAGLVVGLAGGAQAAVQFFDFDAAIVDTQSQPATTVIPTGEVIAVTGGIRCTAGMTFVVQGVVSDQEGNQAFFQDVGECTGSHQQWHTDNVDSDLGFTCGEPVLAQGRVGTTEDRRGFNWQEASEAVCLDNSTS